MIPVILKDFKMQPFNSVKNKVNVCDMVDGTLYFSGTLSEALCFVIKNENIHCLNLWRMLKKYQALEKLLLNNNLLNIRDHANREVVNNDMLNFVKIIHTIYEIPYLELMKNYKSRQRKYFNMSILYTYMLFHYFKKSPKFIGLFLGKSRQIVPHHLKTVEDLYMTDYEGYRTLTEPYWKYWSLHKPIPEEIETTRIKFLSKYKPRFPAF